MVIRSYVVDILRRIMDEVTVAIHADLRGRQRRVTLRVETKLTLAPQQKIAYQSYTYMSECYITGALSAVQSIRSITANRQRSYRKIEFHNDKHISELLNC